MKGLVFQKLTEESHPAIRLLAQYSGATVLYYSEGFEGVFFFETSAKKTIVVDLKQRTFDDVPFAAALSEVNFIHPEELEDDLFPASSKSAKFIMKFCVEAFESGRQSFKIPAQAIIQLNRRKDIYIVDLQYKCPDDGGAYYLQISKTKLVCRCKGKVCAAKGKRYERPSHSTLVTTWNLSFLFSTPAAVAIAFEAKPKKQKTEEQEDNSYPPPPPGYGYVLIRLPK